MISFFKEIKIGRSFVFNGTYYLKTGAETAKRSRNSKHSYKFASRVLVLSA